MNKIKDIIQKLSDWDRKRKFGCEFKDFLITLAFVMVLNSALIFSGVNRKVKIPVMIAVIAIQTIIVNRRPPE